MRAGNEQPAAPTSKLLAVTLATTPLFRGRWLVGVVLTAMALRAVVPVGFMPVAAAGGVAIDFCPGDGARRPGMRMTQPHAHAEPYHTHHSGGAPGAPGAPHVVPCVFAAGATVAGAPSISTVELNAAAATAPPLTLCAPVFSPTIVRAQFPRGPPGHA